MQYDPTMNVSNILGQFLINPNAICQRPNLQGPQIYVPSIISYSASGDNNHSVTFFLPTQQFDDGTKSDDDENSDDCDDDELELELSNGEVVADCASGAENEEGNAGDGEGKGKGKNKPKCVHRMRYSREEYRCESCPYACTTEKAFLKHVRQCTGTGKDDEDQNFPLSCPVCGKDRKNEPSLSVHMVKHKSGKHFCCDLCKFKSIQLKKIIQHRRMHTGEKPHLCPHCSYRSSRRDNLRSHVRRMHNENDLHCDTFTPRKILLVPKPKN